MNDHRSKLRSGLYVTANGWFLCQGLTIFTPVANMIESCRIQVNNNILRPGAYVVMYIHKCLHAANHVHAHESVVCLQPPLKDVAQFISSTASQYPYLLSSILNPYLFTFATLTLDNRMSGQPKTSS